MHNTSSDNPVSLRLMMRLRHTKPTLHNEQIHIVTPAKLEINLKT